MGDTRTEAAPTPQLVGGKTEQGRRLLPIPVGEAEWRYIRRRRQTTGISEDAPTVGVALSGGGIRSATFNFGLLQALAHGRLLRHVDYLSTVSGGGYIGSCFSTLIKAAVETDADEITAAVAHRDAGQTYMPSADPAAPSPLAPDAGPRTAPGEVLDGDAMPLNQRAPIHHLRTHSSFLAVRKGMTDVQLLRMIGSTILGFSYAALLMLGMLIAGLAFGFAYAQWLIGDALIDEFLALPTDVQGKVATGWMAALFTPAQPASLTLWGSVGAVLVLGWVVGSGFALWTFFRGWPRFLAARSGETGDERAERAHIRLFFAVQGVCLILLVIGAVMFEAVLRATGSDPLLIAGIGFTRLFWPSALTFGIGSSLAGWHAIFVRSIRWNHSLRSVYSALHTVAAGFFALTIALVVMIGFLLLTDPLNPLLTLGILAAILVVARIFSGPRLGATTIGQIIVGLAMPAFSIGMIYWTARVMQIFAMENHAGDWLLVAVVMTGVVLVWGRLADFNRISPHDFYADRLSDAFLRTNVHSPSGLVPLRDHRDLLLQHLHGRLMPNAPLGIVRTLTPAPLHLIVCAVNLAGSDDLARRDRKSDHFIFSNFYCGSTTTGYVPTQVYRGGRTTVATAIAISGAAVSSSMGRFTSAGQAFATTLFNLRLGYWALNPRYFLHHVVYAPAAAPPLHERPTAGNAIHIGATEKGTFWPTYLFREMTARTDAHHRLVNLSDGGHTGDNLGLYPLLQRRCRVILASDAGADPAMTHKELTANIHSINVDENVQINIDLREIAQRPKGEPGTVTQPFAIGRIEYPDCTGEARPDRDGDVVPGSWDARSQGPQIGWLIYLKLCRLGDEPPVITSFHAGKPEFPHVPVTQQFFGDDQFEAFRALGDHLANKLLADMGRAASDGAEALAQWCEQQWKANGANGA